MLKRAKHMRGLYIYGKGFAVSLLMLAAVTVFAGGCGSDAVNPPTGTPGLNDNCLTDADCDGELVCSTEGFCIPTMCANNDDCGEKYDCIFGQCMYIITQPDGDETDSDLPDGDKTDTEIEDGNEIPVDGPVLMFPEQIDFGAVLYTQSQNKTCTISNTGNETLEIYFVQVSGGDVDGEFELLSPPAGWLYLAPNDNHTFEIKYTPQNGGADTGEFRIVSNDPRYSGENAATVSLITRYKGVPVISTDPDAELNMGMVLVDTTHPATSDITICNSPPGTDDNAVLEVRAISLDDPYNQHFELKQLPSLPSLVPPRSDAECIRVSLVFRPRERGVLTEHITITSDADNATQKVIAVTGRGVSPDFAIEPGNIDFGRVKVNRSADMVLTITSAGDAPVVINEVKLGDSCPDTFSITDMHTLPHTLAPTEDTTVTVTFAPVSQSVDVCVLEILGGSEEQAMPYSTPIPLKGEGIQGYITIFPASIQYGSVQVGHNKFAPVEISNPGDVDVEVSSLEFMGPSFNFLVDSARSPEFPLVLQPGEMQFVWIGYEPQSERPDSCVVKVNCIEMGEASPEITLSGSGVLPMISVHPAGESGDTIVFDDAQTGVTTTKNVVIQNNGTATLELAEVTLSPSSLNAQIEVGDLGANNILPGSSLTVELSYTPTGMSDLFGYLVVCSNASNANNMQGWCNDMDMQPHAAIVITHVISPHLYVNAVGDEAGITVATEPAHTVNFGFVLEGESRHATVTIGNDGFGPLVIDNVTLDGPADFQLLSVTTPGNQPFPVTLTEDEADVIVARVMFTAPSEGAQQFASLLIDHRDMDLDQYPQYRLHLKVNSGENTEPVAIAKSPPGVPEGLEGTRSIALPEPESDPPAGCTGCLCWLTVDGSESYDVDEGDQIIGYRWEVEPRSDYRFGDGTLPNMTQPTIGFTTYGERDVKLTVTDMHEGNSFETMDSVITVDCQAYPMAAAVEAVSLSDNVTARVGELTTFDGSYSVDPDGEIAEYFWYVCKIDGETCEEHGFGTGETQGYVFTELGDYIVYLSVVDNDGLRSRQRAAVNVHAGYEESLTIKATWSGGGNVDLHYIRPNGGYNTSGDCRPDNATPDWHYQGYGHPVHQNNSTDGVAAEIVNHPDPGDGQYLLTLKYQDPAQDCGYHQACTDYNDDCDRCGCHCLICLGFNCCNDCTICGQEYGCDWITAGVVVRYYVNNALTPVFTEFQELIPTDIIQKPQVTSTINRAGGQYLFQ